MPKFLMTYHGGKMPETPEEGEAMMAEWTAWSASLESALDDPGTPVGITKVLTSDGVSGSGSPHPVMGYSILVADDMDKALGMLGECPHLKHGGTIEVSEMMPMP